MSSGFLTRSYPNQPCSQLHRLARKKEISLRASLDMVLSNKRITKGLKGAQWLSGRVLNSRPRGRGFEPQRRHCLVVLEQDTFILA